MFKKNSNLGTVLNKSEQQSINGGTGTTDCNDPIICYDSTDIINEDCSCSPIPR